MTANLLAFAEDPLGREAALIGYAFSGTCLSESSGGLSRNNDSNMVCEAIRADALVKHIVGQDCQDMGEFSAGFEKFLRHSRMNIFT